MLNRFLSLVLMIFSCSQVIAADKVTLQLKWEHEFQFAGYYAAKWQGFYAQQGLDVDIKSAVLANQRLINPSNELLQGNAQFAIGTSDLLLNTDQDDDPVILASIFQRHPFAFFSLKKTDISSLKKLAKLRIASTPSVFLQMQIAALFASQGYDLGEINFVNQPLTIDTLINNKADVIITYQLSAQFAAQEKGIQLNSLSLAELGLEYYDDALYTTAEYANSHPDIVRKFTEASKQGWLYALEHKQEIAQRIATELPRYLISYDDPYQYNLFFSEKIAQLMAYPEIPVGYVNQRSWVNMHQQLRSLGLIRSYQDGNLVNFSIQGDPTEAHQYYYYLLLFAVFLPVIIVSWYRHYKTLTVVSVLLLISIFELQLEKIFILEKSRIEKEKAVQQLNSITAQLQGQLQNSLSLLTGFAAYISATPNLSYDDYNRYAKALFSKAPILIDFAAAKDLVVNYVYPLAGNEQAIGLNYRHNPSQLISVEQAISGQQALISDPVTLVQGGSALIARAPIFLEGGELWGIISAPLNTQLLFNSSGIDKIHGDIAVAIRSIDPQGEIGPVFFGDPAIFDSSTKVQATIQVGAKQWQVAGDSTIVNEQLPANIVILRIYFVLGGLIVCLFIWFKFSQTSERKKLEIKLRDDKRLLESVGQVAKIGGWKIDPQLHFLKWSEQASLAIDKPKSFQPDSCADIKTLLSEQDFHLWHNKVVEAFEKSKPFNINLQFNGKDNKPLWIKVMCDGKKQEDDFIIGTIQDITEKVLNDQLIEYQASYDSLTDLPNRRTYQYRLKQAIKNALHHNQQLAVLFIDLDRFKPINDNHGHHAGDQVLIETANRLKKMVRKSDTVSRLSGDEFALILNNINTHQDVLALAEKISEQMQSPYHFNNIHVHLSVSIGIAMFPDDGHHADGLLKKADQAMYEVKASGRNGYQFYTQEMQLKSEYRHELLNKLISALKNQELQPYFQPIVDLKTKQIKKCETLARWPQENGHFITPFEFINLAEESGLINKIDLFMLEQSGKDLIQIDSKINLSINVSPRLFHTKDNALQNWVSAMKDISKQVNVTVEITERLLTDDSEKALKVLNQLKHHGVKIAIDDFGTGYSSLNYLIKFPVDIIKIDRSFIKNIGIDSSSEALIETILAMAKRLAIDVVAEGIETAEQLQYLQKHQCAYGQGYFLGKPMSKEDFQALIKLNSV